MSKNGFYLLSPSREKLSLLLAGYKIREKIRGVRSMNEISREHAPVHV